MDNQYIINELCKEAAYHASAYQEKIAALNSLKANRSFPYYTEKTAAGEAEAAAAAQQDPGTMAAISEWLKRQYGNASDAIKGIPGNVSNYFSTLAGDVSGAASEMGNAISGGYGKLKELIPGAYGENMQALKKLYGQAGETLGGLNGQNAQSLDYLKNILGDAGSSMWNAAKGLAVKHPVLATGAALAPLAATGLATAYGMGAFDGDPAMAKQSSYNPQNYQNQKLAALNNVVSTLQQNPEFKQILMNM